MVTGVKGMGKSFLVNQVRQHFTRQNALLAAAQSKEPALTKPPVDGSGQSNGPILWLHGRCRSYGHLRPYSMWLDLMHEWLGTHPEDQASEVQAVLRAQLGAQLDSDVEKDYPNLATFLSTSMEEAATERVKHLDAEGIKRQFFQTVREWIQQLAQDGRWCYRLPICNGPIPLPWSCLSTVFPYATPNRFSGCSCTVQIANRLSGNSNTAWKQTTPTG